MGVKKGFEIEMYFGFRHENGYSARDRKSVV